VSGHALGLLSKGIGDGAFIEPFLSQDGRHRVPQPVDGEARFDFSLLFKLYPERPPASLPNAKSVLQNERKLLNWNGFHSVLLVTH
jgi:hypothetical protein